VKSTKQEFEFTYSNTKQKEFYTFNDAFHVRGKFGWFGSPSVRRADPQTDFDRFSHQNEISQ
jgi:hypothetical protein